MILSKNDNWSLNHKEIVQVYRGFVLTCINLMFEGKLNLIGGCRILLMLRQHTEDFEDPIWDPLIVFEDDTSHIPLGAQRDICTYSEIIEADKDMKDYLELQFAKYDIIEACENIKKKYEM